MLKENNYLDAAMKKAVQALGAENVESWDNHNGPVEDATGGAWVTLCVFVSDLEAASSEAVVLLKVDPTPPPPAASGDPAPDGDTVLARLASHADWLSRGRLGPGQLVERGSALRGAELSCVDLRFADLHNADLSKADLHDAILGYAALSGANLDGADLCDADLSFANLCYAMLRGANLAGANLRWTDLHGAVLGGADLSGADLRSARGITSAGPVGRHHRTVYAVDHGDEILVQAGCRWDTVEAVVAAIEDNYRGDQKMREDYISAVRTMVATLEAQR